MDTGYEHRIRTPPTDKLTTILQQICHIAMPEPNISTCQDVEMWQIFVRWWCSLVVFVAGDRVVELFGSYLFTYSFIRLLTSEGQRYNVDEKDDWSITRSPSNCYAYTADNVFRPFIGRDNKSSANGSVAVYHNDNTNNQSDGTFGTPGASSVAQRCR